MTKSALAHGILATLLLAVPNLAQNAPTAEDVSTSAKLSNQLTKYCDALRDEFKKAPPPAVPNDKCPETTAPDAEVTCRVALVKISTDAFKDVGTLIEKQHQELRTAYAADSKKVQRLHVVLGSRKAELEQVVRIAATDAYKDLKATAGTTVRQAAEAKKVGDVETSIGDKLHKACLSSDAAIIRAAFPSALTAEERAAKSTQQAQDVIDAAEKAAFAEFSKTEGFIRSVVCLWAPKVENETTRPTLTCNPGLLVSGEDVSEIRIKGVPAGETVRVIAMHAEELETDLKEATRCSPEGKSLSCDEMVVPSETPRPLLIAVHTIRMFNPTWGGFLGRTSAAERALRTGDRSKLSLVNDGAPATIAVGVSVGSDFASDNVPVGYARWKIESGGFFSISNQVDHEVQTDPLSGTTKLRVVGVRDVDHVVQDSGIFVNFIPQNYQAIGASLGFATPSNRRMSVLLGPSVRVRTFGNRGLASLAGGLAMRSVLRFPDATYGAEVEADSTVLKGEENFRFGWFVAVNLGFRIGAFGPQDKADGE